MIKFFSWIIKRSSLLGSSLVTPLSNKYIYIAPFILIKIKACPIHIKSTTIDIVKMCWRALSRPVQFYTVCECYVDTSRLIIIKIHSFHLTTSHPKQLSFVNNITGILNDFTVKMICLRSKTKLTQSKNVLQLRGDMERVPFKPTFSWEFS